MWHLRALASRSQSLISSCTSLIAQQLSVCTDLVSFLEWTETAPPSPASTGTGEPAAFQHTQRGGALGGAADQRAAGTLGKATLH